jgi:hypothetical protein
MAPLAAPPAGADVGSGSARSVLILGMGAPETGERARGGWIMGASTQMRVEHRHWSDWDDPGVAEVLNASQDGPGHPGRDGPERRLLLAVLIDAIISFRRLRAGARSQTRRRLLESEHWIRSDDRRWPCSFINVCEALGIAYEPLRRELLRGGTITGATTVSKPAMTRRALVGGTTRETASRKTAGALPAPVSVTAATPTAASGLPPR